MICFFRFYRDVLPFFSLKFFLRQMKLHNPTLSCFRYSGFRLLRLTEPCSNLDFLVNLTILASNEGSIQFRFMGFRISLIEVLSAVERAGAANLERSQAESAQDGTTCAIKGFVLDFGLVTAIRYQSTDFCSRFSFLFLF